MTTKKRGRPAKAEESTVETVIPSDVPLAGDYLICTDGEEKWILSPGEVIDGSVIGAYLSLEEAERGL